ncbi:MAG: hypothetical protein ABSC89_07365 [Verrucomicrobiota bacterium]|jgi:hypothetical protein
MSTPSDLEKVWAERGDLELYEALDHPDDYGPGALDVVKRELTKRNLPPDREAYKKAVASARQAALKKAQTTTQNTGEIPTGISIAFAAVTFFLFRSGQSGLAWIVIIVGGLALGLFIGWKNRK